MFYLNFDTFLEYVEGIDIKKGGVKTARFICDVSDVVFFFALLGTRTSPTTLRLKKPQWRTRKLQLESQP